MTDERDAIAEALADDTLTDDARRALTEADSALQATAAAAEDTSAATTDADYPGDGERGGRRGRGDCPDRDGSGADHPGAGAPSGASEL